MEEKRRANQAAIAEAAEAKRRGQAALDVLAEKGKFSEPIDYLNAAQANPDLAQYIQSYGEMVGAERMEGDTQLHKKLFVMLNKNPDAAKIMLEEQLAAAQNAGDPEAAALMESYTKMADSPEGQDGLRAMVGTALVEMVGKDAFTVLTDQLGLKQGNADVQSTDYLGGIAVVTTLKDGTVQIKDARSNEVVTGDAAKTLLEEAREGEALMAGGKAGAAEEATLGARINFGRIAAAETEMGSKAVQLGIDAFSRIGLVNANIANLDRAIQLVEEEGANTGVIASRLPSWSDATIELQNMQNVLGLDVIGSVTFGALSESELALAMQTALPTGLSEKALADWLRTKKAAQKKLAGYLTQQAEFFSTGRGPDQWLAFTKSGQKDVNKWMRENPLGRTAAAPAPTSAGAASQGLSAEDLKYLEVGE
jgi:hypothetical protein